MLASCFKVHDTTGLIRKLLNKFEKIETPFLLQVYEPKMQPIGILNCTAMFVCNPMKYYIFPITDYHK